MTAQGLVAGGPALAAGTEMAAAPTNDHPPDKGATAWTRLTVSLVSFEARQVIPRPSVDIDVIPKTGSLKCDGFLKYMTDGLEKLFRLGGAHTICRG